MFIALSDIEAAIDQPRSILRLDGADVSVDSEKDGIVTMTLSLAEVECLDCVLPRRRIEAIILSHLSKSFPSIAGVALNDPRDG